MVSETMQRGMKMGSTRLPKGKRKKNGKMINPDAREREMVNIATNMTLLAMLLSYRDEFGHGRTRTIRGMERFKNNVMCLRDGRLTLEDIAETLKKELGDDIFQVIGIE